LEVATLDQLDRRFDTVAGKSGADADTDLSLAGTHSGNTPSSSVAASITMLAANNQGMAKR
jgi:hypothetical protein